MKKRNGNFEYFKPQNGSLGATESESNNSNDSDSKEMFSLPKRKVLRPRKLTSRTTRKCCRVCLAASLPLIISILIVGMCSSIVYVLLGINGMKREMELLKVGLKQVESADHSNLKENAKLQLSLKEQLVKMKKDEDKLVAMDRKLLLLHEKVNKINVTVMKLAKSMQRKRSFNSIVKDVDQLQKGMADTFNNIKRIEDDSVKMSSNVGILSKTIKEVRLKVINVTKDIIKFHSKSSSKSQASIKSQKQSEKISAILEKVLNGYENKLANKTKTIAKVLRSHEIRIEKLNSKVAATENMTSSHHRQLELLKKISVLLTAEVKAYSNSSENKLDKIIKLILVDLTKSSANLTADLLAVRPKVPGFVQKLISKYVESVKRKNLHTSVPTTNSTVLTTPLTPSKKGIVNLTSTEGSRTSVGPTSGYSTSDTITTQAMTPLQATLNTTKSPEVNLSRSSSLSLLATTPATNHSSPLSVPSINSTGVPVLTSTSPDVMKKSKRDESPEDEEDDGSFQSAPPIDDSSEASEPSLDKPSIPRSMQDDGSVGTEDSDTGRNVKDKEEDVGESPMNLRSLLKRQRLAPSDEITRRAHNKENTRAQIKRDARHSSRFRDAFESQQLEDAETDSRRRNGREREVSDDNDNAEASEFPERGDEARMTSFRRDRNNEDRDLYRAERHQDEARTELDGKRESIFKNEKERSLEALDDSELVD